MYIRYTGCATHGSADTEKNRKFSAALNVLRDLLDI